MIKRLFINGYRCFSNFELKFGSSDSVLILGTNGTGKSTLLSVLKIFRDIGQGQALIDNLINVADLAFNRKNEVMRFEIEVDLDEGTYLYSFSVDWLEVFNDATVKRFRIRDEKLLLDGNELFSRQMEKITMPTYSNKPFLHDWHTIWLATYKTPKGDIFKNYLAKMILVSPVPSLMKSDSDNFLNYYFIKDDATNIIPWFRYLNSSNPEVYNNVKKFLRETIFPELEIISFSDNENNGSAVFTFRNEGKELKLDFCKLSDGQKCFIVAAVVYAFAQAFKTSFCFWDEIENYISEKEQQILLTCLRDGFKNGYFMFTTHSSRILSVVSEKDAIILKRKSNLEPIMPPIFFSEELKKSTWMTCVADAIDFSGEDSI